jgi:plasmid maintenance system antidote protein VapI
MRPDIRQAIVAAIDRRKININQLATLVEKHVHRSHVYDFVAGRKELTTDKANHLLQALELIIVANESHLTHKR